MRTIQSELIEKGLKQNVRCELSNANTRTSNKKKETLTLREIEDLMGCNRDTYKRVRGSVKRR